MLIYNTNYPESNPSSVFDFARKGISWTFTLDVGLGTLPYYTLPNAMVLLIFTLNRHLLYS